MKTYQVLVTRDVTESTLVDVQADSPEEARAQALQETTVSPENFDWTPDDCTGGEPYIADDDAELEEEDCECGQCEGTGTIEGGPDGDSDDEMCTVCDGTGMISE